jgi:hypothetical protein
MFGGDIMLEDWSFSELIVSETSFLNPPKISSLHLKGKSVDELQTIMVLFTHNF